MHSRTRSWILLTLGVFLGSCGSEPPARSTDVVVAETEQLPTGPFDEAWEVFPIHVASLLPQDLVDPRTLEISTASVTVRAATDGRRMAFRLEWDDPSRDDRPGPSRYSDACAIQVPRDPGPDLPAPQMGEVGREVEIAFWRATQQAAVEAPRSGIRDVYPNATVDHYPFDAPALEAGSVAQEEMENRYSPARNAENPVTGPHASPVQGLLAHGPGTLTADETAAVDGSGEWADGKWTVLISRPIPPGWEERGGQIAFAIWDGSLGEVGARKMRTAWIPLTRSSR